MVHGAFHAKDGLYFRRVDEDQIEVSFEVLENSKPPYVTKTIQIIVSVDIFASVICSVSNRGEDSFTWKEALDFLNKKRGG